MPRLLSCSSVCIALLIQGLHQLDLWEGTGRLDDVVESTWLGFADRAGLAKTLESLGMRGRGQDGNDAASVCDFLSHARSRHPSNHSGRIAL